MTKKETKLTKYDSVEFNLYQMIRDNQREYPKNLITTQDILDMFTAYELSKEESIKFIRKFISKYPFKGNVDAIKHNKNLTTNYYDKILSEVELGIVNEIRL